MLNYYYIVSFLGLWHLLFLGFCRLINDNLSKNIVHFIHALIFVLYYNTNYDKSYLIDLSSSFYIYDLFYIILQIIQLKSSIYTQGPFVVHHIIAIYGLHLSSLHTLSEFILKLYYILENSNFMLYIAYHVNKTCKKDTYFVKFVELIQYFWYTYFRVVYFTLFIISNINTIVAHKDIVPHIVLIILYSMGLFWSYKLFIKNTQNFALITKEIKPKIE